MAFRTVVGQDYKAKNALDAFIESRENKARTETKISNSALQNVGQAAVMASDAFFPFRDGIDNAAERGIAAVIQPGGSMRDEEVIAAADEAGMAMVFTGMRHFRH